MTQPILPDLTVCDLEPIHVPGSIQPHGFLLAVDQASKKVRWASRNLTECLALELDRVLDQNVGEVLGAAAAHALQGMMDDDLSLQRALYFDQLNKVVDGAPRSFILLAHRQGGWWIIEGERLPANYVRREMHYRLEGFLARMSQVQSVAALLQVTAEQTRELTGFDRVLIYKFDPDWHGIVVAESRNDVLPSYLDLRFPASDIPRQARELYRRNRLRLIARADYQPVPLVASRQAGQKGGLPSPLDLSLATLRSVSPVHLEYMKNMGTGSSMSISIMRDGVLWGLISCHSRDPWIVTFDVRATCELLGDFLSLQLGAHEYNAVLAYQAELRAPITRLVEAMALRDRFTDGLLAESAALLQVTAAAGAAVIAEGEIALRGRTPTKAEVDALVQWFAAHQGDKEVFFTDALPTLFPEANQYAWAAAGLLVVSISRVHRTLVLWFRPEVVETVTWGGDPHKPTEVSAEGQMRLHPRKSFDLWVETVRGRSLSWKPQEIDAARELRAAVINVVLQSAERLAQMSEQLSRINKELESFSYTVSHDLRAPFRHIRGYAELLKIEKGARLDEEGRQFVDFILSGATYAGNLVDSIISFSQMGRAQLNQTAVPMDELVERVVAGVRLEAVDREIEWTIAPLPTVPGDPDKLRTVLQNLIENAVKFTRGRNPARIEIGATETADETVIFVRDNGVGFDPQYRDKLFGIFQRLHQWEEFEGTGIGLASVRRIVGRHGGRVWAESIPQQGATFFFALPKSPVMKDALYA